MQLIMILRKSLQRFRIHLVHFYHETYESAIKIDLILNSFFIKLNYKLLLQTLAFL